MERKQKEPTKQEIEMAKLSETATRLGEHTITVMMPLWADNIANNMSRILDGKSVDQIPKRKGEPALVIAAGPSLKKREHLKMLSNSHWKHPIITCDRELVKCLMRNIVPYCVCSVDANPEVANFYKHSLVSKFDVHTVFNIAVHPKVTSLVNEIYWFISFLDDANNPMSLTRMMHFMTHKPMLMTGGNVGTFSWNLAMYLGCNPIILVGFDLSYATRNIAKSLYYKKILKMLGGDKKKTKKLFAMGRHPVYGNKYVLDPIFRSYLEFFRNYARTAHRLYGLKTVNATEGGAVFGEGIECTTLKEALRRYK